MMLLLAAALASPPGLIDDSDARTIHSWDPTPVCREWTQARSRNNAQSATFEAWVTGMITGYNLYNADRQGDILRGNNLANVFVWIDRRCAVAPERAMVEIATEFVDEARSLHRATLPDAPRRP